MAEIAEGFTVNAVITLDDYLSTDFVGDIIHGRGIVSEEEKAIAANAILNSYNQDGTIGELLRANSGSQGFTLKSSVLLDNSDITNCLADIAHSRCIVKDDAGDILSSLTLNSNNKNEYIGDLIRANSGSQGFTLKSSLILNTPDTNNYFADIAHTRCIITNNEDKILASVTLDEESAKEILGDITRSNSGQQGFTLRASSRLNNYDENSLIADIYRSISGRRKATTGVIDYKGKRYLVYTNDSIHYFITKSGEE